MYVLADKHGMSRLKFFLSVFIGFSVYILLSITVGQNGIWAYHQLELEKDALTENVAHLKSVNDNLLVDCQSLQSDEVHIKALARRLGYVNDGEVLVKINGISDRGLKVYDCGTVYHMQKISYLEEHICKVMGLLFFGLSWLLFFVTGLKKQVPSISVETKPAFDLR